MARNHAYETDWTVAVLTVQPTDRVLEVGFGPGLAIALAARRASRGLVAGIDHSPAMVRAARRRNAAALRAGRVELRQGDVAAIPYETGGFTKAMSLHGLSYWPAPHAALRELHRVLRPGGLLALTLLPREAVPAARQQPSGLYRLYDSAEVCVLLSEAGFSLPRVHTSPDPTKFAGVVVVGERRV
jgi:ubiquinone/menaquinone biosynthesis C-methylase UbiE